MALASRQATEAHYAGYRAAVLRAVPSIRLLVFLAAIVGCKLLLMVLYAQRHGGIEQFACGWTDCYLYAGIARKGYSDGLDPVQLEYWAHFPLFSLLVRAVALVSSLGWQKATIAAANLCYVGFLFMGFRYTQATRGQQTGRAWLLVGLCFPYTLYFSVGLSESLYGLLAIAAAGALRDGRPYRASGLIALLGATRPTGVLFIPIIMLDRARAVWRDRATRPTSGLIGLALLPVAIAPIGLTAFMAYQYWAIGDGLAFSHVQAFWQRHWQDPICDIWRGLRANDWYAVNWLIDQSTSYNAWWAVIGLASATYLCCMKRLSEAWIVGATVLLAAATGLNSMQRFVGTNPFFLLGVSELVSRLRTRWLAVTIGLLVGVHTLFLVEWHMKAHWLW